MAERARNLKYIVFTDMSTRYIPPKTTLRQKKLQWMNLLAHIHDERCDCPNPLEHTILLIVEQEKELKFNAPEKDLIKKCLSGDTITAVPGDPTDDVIGDGELAALFAEELGEEENTG